MPTLREVKALIAGARVRFLDVPLKDRNDRMSPPGWNDTMTRGIGGTGVILRRLPDSSNSPELIFSVKADDLSIGMGISVVVD